MGFPVTCSGCGEGVPDDLDGAGNESCPRCRSTARVILVLGPLGNFVCSEDVGYGKDAGVSGANCRCLSFADVGFERLRSAVNIVAACRVENK
jgi:hypothetical protein